MKIALVGYGKMGKAIERLAKDRGHHISSVIDLNPQANLDDLTRAMTDVAIEFSRPEAAYNNLSMLIGKGIPTISGTTGWLDQLEEIKEMAQKTGTPFLYASNFSLGVNLFFELNQWLAGKMRNGRFSIKMEETHHTEKLDAPSGTAITIAENIMLGDPHKKGWLNEETADQTKIGIVSKREPNVPGTHSVEYSTPLESIKLTHTAHSRDIFANGAIDVAEWITDQKGFLTMEDYLNHLS